VFGGKSLSEIPARDLLPVAVMVAIAIINLWAIHRITQCMNEFDAWHFLGVDALIGPVLIGLRSVRVVGLALLALGKKHGFHIFAGASAAEFVLYVVMYLVAPSQLDLALQILDLTPFEMIGAILIMLVMAPLLLWQLIADRWETLK
jgi:hypothetical protein